MFEVRLTAPFDDDWQDRDEKIDLAAGRTSDFAGAGGCQRDHGWKVPTFQEARDLQARLLTVPEVSSVTIREETTER